MTRLLCIFEYSIPRYRDFLVEWIRETYEKVEFVHGGDRLPPLSVEGAKKALSLFAINDDIIAIFSPWHVWKSDVILTTLNIRRPHTWMYALFFPWKKWIFWGQGVGRSRNPLVKFLRQALFRVSHGYLVYTPEGMRQLISHGYPAERIQVAYNTVRVRNSQLTTGDKYFLYLGRLQERKKIHWAFPGLRKSGKKMLVVGDGEYGKELRRLARIYGVERQVKFRSAISDDDGLLSAFGGAIAYVSPGHVGLGVVHAFAYGVPVITLTTRQHAPEFEYCNQENAYLCEKAEDLVSAMGFAADNNKGHEAKRREAQEFFRTQLTENQPIRALKALLDG